MRLRGLLVGWVALALVVVLGLLYELKEWRAIDAKRSTAATEKKNLQAQIQVQDEEIRREERAHSDLIRDMQWSSNRGDPSAFLNGLAEFAQGARLKVMAIGPLERQAVSQFSKSWHTVQVLGPYREVKDLATRIEKEGGILEDVTLQATNPAAGAAASDEIDAKMKLTAIELTPQAKAILQRLATSQPAAAAGPKPQPALALPLPASKEAPTLAVRDPFAFASSPAAASPTRVASAGVRSAAPQSGTGTRTAAAPATPPATQPTTPATPEPPPAAMEVKGIVKFPGGHLAIVNNQIVQVGDLVDGHRVEQISDTTVVVRQAQGSPRSLSLPTVTAPQPAAPRR